MSFKNLTFERILKDVKKFELSQDNSYQLSYIEFLNYFENLNKNLITEHNLVIASHFVYGWMPTIINLDLKEKKEILELLNKVKAGDYLLRERDLEILKKAINNSLVGLSKLLHFINPRIYAIWDRRIFRYITEKKSTYGIGNPKNYLKYLEGIKKISRHPNFKKIESLIIKKVGYEVCSTRVIEIIMFEADRKAQTKK